MAISKQSVSFLTHLSKNNNKDWFTENKPEYISAHENMVDFADEVLTLLNEIDKIETPTGKKALKRIYRDVRFSKNKTPYKNNFGLSFSRQGASRRGGFYVHIQPNASFIGGGFWSPEKEDLQRIRKHVEVDDSELRKILSSKDFQSTFGTMTGEQLKTAPKGFDKEHSAIDLLRYKQFLIGREFTDTEVLTANFATKVAETLEAMLPFFNVMTEMLTTNLNGESLID
ncbi:MAG: hypothetical protein ACI9GM_000180 [Salibacteraceae bacterium]|jgi:uncharacterized protein (TIGR02453 family)